MIGFRDNRIASDAAMARYAALRREATFLAGTPADGARRAAVYRDMFSHSGGNHVFPLIAAHGALWALGYFRLGLRLGRVVSLPYAVALKARRRRLDMLDAFSLAFREINRRVFIETYTFYRLTDESGFRSLAEEMTPPALFDQLARCHAARRAGRELSLAEKRELFSAFFLWEQDNIVGPEVDSAVAAFDWPMMKRLALRPNVAFAYLPREVSLRFEDFADKSERIRRGLEAFDAAARVGFDRVEKTLHAYGTAFEAPRVNRRVAPSSSCALNVLSQ